MGEVTVVVGFDAVSRRVTIDGVPTGEPIAVGVSRIEAEGFDYQAEAYKTCSPHWNPQHVNFDAFRRTLEQYVEICGVLNIYYKLLLRGKTPDQFDLPMPPLDASLAAHGGTIPPAEIDLVHGILGSATEVGELVEVLLDMVNGKAPDRVNVVEEVGDMRWFLNLPLRWADCSDRQCEVTNIDKLHGRHGTAFDIFRDANRDLSRERQALEAGAEPKQPTPPARRFFGQSETVERRPIGDVPGMDA